MQIALGLTLALISAIAVNWAYAREHEAAAAMPPFSPRQPVRFVSLLLGNRRWLTGFATETAGWLVYVAALRLAPISLVQAICASGIAVLALTTAHGHPAALAPNEQRAVLIAFVGLILLSFSLVDTRQVDHSPAWAPIALWLGGSAALALTLATTRVGLPRAPALGLAAGLLFAGGDISAKLVGYGGAWLVAAVTLVLWYALGTSILQGAFQHGDALTGAGLATLATNALPIAAGFLVFGEELPPGVRGVMQLAAFAALVASAASLAHVKRRGRSEQPLSRGTPVYAPDVEEALLRWFSSASRSLPWRHTTDPYAILVSEVMAQQTQAERVAPRWQRWLERWPTVEALAAASAADVIAEWQGLGYNRRALALHRAARQIAVHGWPDDLTELPGVGRYTADAVACFAFGRDVLPVDVNVTRIRERTGAEFTSAAAQALMDLGATVCLARVPRCGVCPLAGGCPSRGQRFEPLRKQGPLEGSFRQRRARTLRAVIAGEQPEDEEAVASLARDGLVRVDDGRVSLPA